MVGYIKGIGLMVFVLGLNKHEFIQEHLLNQIQKILTYMM